MTFGRYLGHAGGGSITNQVRSGGAQSAIEVQDAVIGVLVPDEEHGGIGNFLRLAKSAGWDFA